MHNSNNHNISINKKNNTISNNNNKISNKWQYAFRLELSLKLFLTNEIVPFILELHLKYFSV